MQGSDQAIRRVSGAYFHNARINRERRIHNRALALFWRDLAPHHETMADSGSNASNLMPWRAGHPVR